MSVRTIGFNEFRAKLNNLPKNMEKVVGAYVRDAALDWEQRAKRSAPVDNGFLRGQITSKSTGVFSAVVTSNQFYSPYVEWGTGTRVQVPVDLAQYALQFKGVKKVVGRFPKPFFFIQKPLIEKELFGKITKFLNTPQ